MVGLLTWPVHGHWLRGPARGRTDGDGAAVPEPDPSLARRRRPALKWPPLRLDHRQRTLVVRDLARLAPLRGFVLHVVVAAADHVHVLLSCESGRDTRRLVQLVKGSLSRTLSIEAGDVCPEDERGLRLPHHKWWARQHAFGPIEDRRRLEAILADLIDHETRSQCEVVRFADPAF